MQIIGPAGRGMLAMDMGTGKTRTALALADEWGCRRVLIACPKSVVRVWPREFRKHLGDTWQIMALDTGAGKDRAEAVAAGWMCADLDGARLAVALNYEVLPALLPTLQALEWDLLVLDECHRIKAPEGRQSMAAFDVSKKVPHRLGLTGTPMPHSQLDVFAQFRAIDPLLFGLNYHRFEATFAEIAEEWVPKHNAPGDMKRVVAAAAKLKELPAPDLAEWLANKGEWQVKWAVAQAERDGRTQIANFIRQASGAYRKVRAIAKDDAGKPVYRNSEKLAETMAPITFRVEANDVLDLPDSIDESRYCLLGPATRRVYRQLYEEFSADYGAGKIEAKNFLSRVLRLAQVANGFGVDAETGEIVPLGAEKEDLFGDLLDDLPEGEPVVVFGRFTEDLRAVHRQSNERGRRCLELSGQRRELEQWQQATGGEILAVQLQAGGVGIDLTRARYQVYYSMDYNLGNYLQTRARVLRPGQTRSVTYLHLLAADTVDEAIAQALADRDDVTGAIVRRLKRAT